MLRIFSIGYGRTAGSATSQRLVENSDIIDSNVLFSALIRKSTVRRIILEHDEPFLFPEFIFEEMQERIGELLKKSGLNNKDFNHLLRLILGKVTIIPKEMLYPHREEAMKIIGNIDKDDALFIACALAYQGSAI